MIAKQRQWSFSASNMQRPSAPHSACSTHSSAEVRQKKPNEPSGGPSQLEGRSSPDPEHQPLPPSQSASRRTDS